jgi:MarR family multiple antibiotic resistance transcriptional regulator
MEKEKPDISYGLWQLLNRTRQLITNLRRRELNQHGVTVRQSMVMRTVLRLGQQATPTAISRETYFDLSSISEQLTRMEKIGLIKKINDLERKNKVRIELTAKGLELYHRVKTRKSIKNVMLVLSENDRDELWRILTHLRNEALVQLGRTQANPYPPENPDELWEEDFI